MSASRFIERAPPAALRGFVDRLWLRWPGASRARATAVAPVRVLPDGCIDVLVPLDGAPALVVGVMTGAVLVQPRAAGQVAVRFRPGGAAPFLGVPARALTDLSAPLADLGSVFGVRLARAPATPRAALDALEAALLGHLARVARPDPRVAHAAAALFAPAPPDVGTLAGRLGWSRQHLTRAFQHHIGLGPKQLGRIARLQRAILHLQHAPGAALAEAALDLGYADQAHMCRDFQDLAGVSPTTARAATGSISPIRSLLTEAWSSP
ncbi:MAG: AraC family transcriptional regulator [Deltaproteobacteria bacterium]|nr:AraC family transcriptional regulator [Deltaproteobacteria bacterium]